MSTSSQLGLANTPHDISHVVFFNFHFSSPINSLHISRFEYPDLFALSFPPAISSLCLAVHGSFTHPFRFGFPRRGIGSIESLPLRVSGWGFAAPGPLPCCRPACSMTASGCSSQRSAAPCRNPWNKTGLGEGCGQGSSP